MTTELELIESNLAGWNAIHDTNIEKLDELLVEPIQANNSFGDDAQNANSNSQADPDAITTTSNTLQTISGTGDDTNINANFTEISTQIQNTITDLSDLKTKLEGTIDYIDSIKTDFNSLLAKLRKSSGCGVLSG